MQSGVIRYEKRKRETYALRSKCSTNSSQCRVKFFVMGLMPFGHAAFCFRHGAFAVWTWGVFISSWGVSLSVMGHIRSAATSGWAASPLPAIRRRMGNEDVAPPWFCKCLYKRRRINENMVWTDSQDYGADEILYTIGTVLFNINNRLMREITILFEVYPRLFQQKYQTEIVRGRNRIRA